MSLYLPQHLTVEFLMQRQVFLCEFVARLKINHRPGMLMAFADFHRLRQIGA